MTPEPRQDRALRSRLRILEAASALFGERGFDATAIGDIAQKADLSVGLVCRYFPTREHLALAVYERLADGLVAAAVELPPGTLAERFRQLMRWRVAQCDAHRRTLTALLGKALDPQSPIYVLGDATEHARAKVHGALGALVVGAKDAPRSEADLTLVTQLLYTVHLGVVLATLTRPTVDWAHALIDRAVSAVKWLRPSLPLVRRFVPFDDAVLLDRPRAPARKDARAVALRILECLFRDNRVLPGVKPGLTPASAALHLPRVLAFVHAQRPIELVLPAFPAKAPNPKKVLGPLPDLAEERSLERLSELLDAIGEVWKPGARLVVCSDGHVFADAVGVEDADVARYRAGLLALLDDARIGWFDLEDAFGEGTPAQMRALLLDRHGASVDALRARAAASPAVAAQLDGIHRFLFEDEVVRRPALSRSQAKKATREKAYEVVRRSEAWGALLADVFPAALRLSIHPQPDPSAKIGLNLLGVKDPWLTPWHATAVVSSSGTTLMHRADAEALGARVVTADGRPSYLAL